MRRVTVFALENGAREYVDVYDVDDDEDGVELDDALCLTIRTEKRDIVYHPMFWRRYTVEEVADERT